MLAAWMGKAMSLEDRKTRQTDTQKINKQADKYVCKQTERQVKIHPRKEANWQKTREEEQKQSWKATGKSIEKEREKKKDSTYEKDEHGWSEILELNFMNPEFFIFGE